MKPRTFKTRQKSRPSLPRLAKPAVAIFATLGALLAGEALIRGMGLAPATKPIQLSAYDCIYKRSTNPLLGFELKAAYRSANPDFIQTYERTNAHGQRDRERRVEKPEGGQRILLLGDSVVEGHGLRETETIPHQLERLFADEAIECLNFGVSAYCTLAEIELLAVKGLAFDPDVVVLVFVENDFDNFNREAFPLEGTIRRPAPVKTLFQRSHLFRLACVRLNLFHFGAEADPVRWNKDAIGDNNVAQGLQRFRTLADRHGFQPLVAVWPRFLDDRVTDVCYMPQGSQQLVVEHLAAMVDIPSIRLSGYFRRHRAASAASASPRLKYSSGDELHPSPEGARVAAEALKEILTDLDAGSLASPSVTPRPQGHDGAALAAAQRLGQAQPNYARVYSRVGTEYLKKGELAQAVAAFKQALEADPQHAGAHHNLGLAYERQGRSDAQACFERAIRLRADFTEAHYNLARVQMKEGRLAAAVAALRQTLEIDPDHVGALNMLGTALGRQRRFAEAQSHLERAVRLDPQHAEARSNLGAAYAGQGRLLDAVTQFEAALRIDPDDPEARENLIRVNAALSKVP